MRKEFIPLDELKIGECYELDARNLQRGIWDGERFHGIRYKFGDHFMDAEIHYDLNERYGTAQAIRKQGTDDKPVRGSPDAWVPR